MYNALAQTDQLEAASSASDDASDRSPVLQSPSFAPLALDFENFGGSAHREAAADTAPDSLLQSATAIMRPAAAYELVEPDEYAVDIKKKDTPEKKESNNNMEEPVLKSPRSRRNSTPLRHPTPDLQSIQGAYVGNVERLEKSAERISMEIEAERELGALRRMSSSRSRAASGGSIANSRAAPGSPVAAVGASSAPGYGSLSRQSSLNRPRVRSGSSASRLAHIIEPENESADMATIPPPPDHPEVQLALQALENGLQYEQNEQYEQHGQYEQNGQYGQNGQYEQNGQFEQPQHGARPESAASGDTYQQSTNLFRDFDGVHFTPHMREASRSRGVSLSKPPLAAEAGHYSAPPPGQDMVYYPAPVPMMLNLPQRLSRKPAQSEQEKRRTQLINSISPDARKSAAWITDAENTSTAGGDRLSKRLSNLPPQLRASAFFDAPKTQIDVRIQGESAVATLDGILDAAAHAPVSAFTDHPIVGHLGADVYKQKRPKNKINKKRTSLKPGDGVSERSLSSARAGHVRANSDGQALDNIDERTSLRSTFDDHADHEHESRAGDEEAEGEEDEDEEEEDEEETKDDEPIHGPPTTLLAELQMRKHQQKMRTRTAATAFPNGMHSTLLELDSVAQRQQEKRDKGRVTLAWEGNQSTAQDEIDDEDVPLGVLFPEQSRLADENRPLGLMEKLLLDESEPLSRRRARIRGEPLNTGRATPRNLAPRDPSPDKRASAAFTLDIPGLTDNTNGNDESGDEEETLAQRKSRLRAREGNDFDDLISKFGDLDTDKAKGAPASASASAPAPAEAEEETLGQRRKRLQAEAQKRSNPAAAATATSAPYSPLQRRSMANILQAHPARPGAMTAHSELDLRYQTPAAMASTHSLLQMPPTRASMLATTPLSMGGHRLSGTPMLPYSHGPPPGTAPATLNGSGMLGGGGFGYPANGYVYNPASMHPAGGQQETIDPRQRDMIDRWRLSVRQ